MHYRAGLGHGENVSHGDRVLVDELSDHEPHDFHRDACSPVLEHLEQGQRRYVQLGRGAEKGTHRKVIKTLKFLVLSSLYYMYKNHLKILVLVCDYACIKILHNLVLLCRLYM